MNKVKFKLEDTEKDYSQYFKPRDQSLLTRSTYPTKVSAINHLRVLSYCLRYHVPSH